MLEKKSKSIKGGARPGAGRPKGSQNKVTLELKEAAQVYTADALETLAKICKSSKASDAARVAAACALLDRGHGRPRQQVDMQVNEPLLPEVIVTIGSEPPGMPQTNLGVSDKRRPH
jgi:hypothetical protein